MLKKIVTHPGTAHGDDFLACCILAAKFGALIERHEPSQAELDDAETLVLDVGGRLEPEKNNFDHHHDMALPCALVLLLKHIGLHERFQRAYRWYDNVDFRDRNGLKALGAKYNLTDEQVLELGSPVHTMLISMFEKLSALDCLPNGYEQSYYEDVRDGNILYEIMRRIGKELIDHAEKYGAAWDRLEKCEAQNLRGYPVLINPSDDITATGDYMRERKIVVMCSHDNRGAGWAILRSNDFPKINLALLANDPRIAFAHKGGFIAKTKERVSVDTLFELLKLVV